MRWVPAVALMLLAGCGDPASSRLSIGIEAIVRVPEADPKRPPIPTVTLSPNLPPEPVDFIEPDTIATKTVNGEGYRIQAGSKVRVISDDQAPDVRGADKPYLADLDGQVDRRWVKVKVLDGRSADAVGELPRNTLRAVK